MAGYIDRIIRPWKTGGQGQGPGDDPAAPGPLRTGRQVGAGGEGVVYEDADDPRMVIKVLHPQHATPDRAAKLQAMCDNPPPNARMVSWPNKVQAEAGGLRYRMPRAPDGDGTAYRFVSANERRRLPPPQQEYEYRTKLGVKIAEAFRQLHTIHVRIGDVNPHNILVSDEGLVTLIDCDSFQIPRPDKEQPFPCVVGSPEYTAPEIHDFSEPRDQDGDNFALAVLLYQLLGDGSHPYQGIDEPSGNSVSDIRARIKEHRFAHRLGNNGWRPRDGQLRSWEAMPTPVQDAFRTAFSTVSMGRPTADAWVSILEQNPYPATDGVNQVATPPDPVPHGAGDAGRKGRIRKIQTVAVLATGAAVLAAGIMALLDDPGGTDENWIATLPAPAAAGNETAPVSHEGATGWTYDTPGTSWRQISTPDATAISRVFGPWTPPRMTVQPAVTTVPAPTPEPTATLMPTATLVPPAPDPVASISVVHNGSSLTVSWEAPARATHFDVTYRGNGANARAAWNRAGASLTITCDIRPEYEDQHCVDAGATYTVGVRARNAAGESEWRNSAPAAVLSVTPAPAVPTPTPAPTEWLIQHPAHPKITGAKAGTTMLLQGCYLGNGTAARRFRLASWDVWDPGRYGSELKFVKIVTNNGARLRLETGACYEVRGDKHVDSPEEYVCLDRNAVHPWQTPCDSYRENEVMPTFILYPDRADDPENFTDSFILIRKPSSE